MKKKAFTMVELIVVIVIISIISIIGYISYNGYLLETKDINRVNQISNIGDGIDLKLSKGVDIMPDQAIEIIVDSKKYSTQGLAGKTVIGKAGYYSNGLDPKDNEYFTYTLGANKKDYEIMALLEDESNLPKKSMLGVNTYNSGERIPYLYGKNSIGVLVDDFLVPLNKYMSGTINIDCNFDEGYKMIFENGKILDGIIWQSEFENGPCYQEPLVGCKTQPTYSNASYSVGVPSAPNQEWVKGDTTESCSYQCTGGYTGIFCEVLPGMALASGKIPVNNSIVTKKLGIYYGYPSSLNSYKNDYHMDSVITDLNEYNTIILADGLQETGHSDNLNTSYLLKGVGPSILWYAPSGFNGYNGESYGYVTLMNNISSINSTIDKWKTLGVNGIFFDEAGYDFLIDNYTFTDKISARNHQNSAISYAQSIGLKVMLNSWVVDDVFGTAFGELATTINSNGSYLLENFVYNPNTLPTYYDYDNQTQKISKSLSYKSSLGIDLHCVGLLPDFVDITTDKINIFYEKAISVCDYIQITEVNFGSGVPNIVNYLKSFK